MHNHIRVGGKNTADDLKLLILKFELQNHAKKQTQLLTNINPTNISTK